METELAERETYGYTALEPAFESLTNEHSFSAVWPELVLQNPDVIRQVRERQAQISVLETIIQKVSPTTEIDEALQEGLVEAAEVADLLCAMSEVLANHDYRRLILYFPFEFLPRSDYAARTPELAHAYDTFKSSYLEAWYELLTTLDVRANFVDGDVLEAELREGDLPRVVKATHLIPKLIEKGWLTEDDIHALLKQPLDSILKRDLEAALAVVDSGYNSTRLKTDVLESEPTPDIVAGALNNLIFREFEDSLSPNLTRRRRNWLIEKQRSELIEHSAILLADSLIQGETKPTEISSLLAEGQPAHLELYIETVREVFMRLVQQNSEHNTPWLDATVPQIIERYERFDMPVKKRANMLLRHLTAYEVIPPESLDQLGLSYTNFGASYRENSLGVQAKAREILITIGQNPHLYEVMHCVIALGGSQIKGYGEPDSDLDIAVFMKASIGTSERQSISEKVIEIFTRLGEDCPTFIWTNESDAGLEVDDIPGSDPYTATPFWVHTLFNTVWIGRQADIEELRGKLLPNYFYALDEDGNEQPKRAHYLERLEQDSLQYRLMHKGYRRHMPPQGMPTWRQGKLVDAGSVFWDSGYRHIATRLFLKTVFLPSIS